MDRRLMLPCALLSLALSDSLVLFHTAQAAQIEETRTKTQIHLAGCSCPSCSRTTPVVEP